MIIQGTPVSGAIGMGTAVCIKDPSVEALSSIPDANDPTRACLATGVVLVVDILTTAMAVALNGKNVAGILTETGGRTSHAAIISSMQKIPVLLGIPHVTDLIEEGVTIIVDETDGTAIIDPDMATVNKYMKKKADCQARRAALNVFREQPTVDADGKGYCLFANAGSVQDVEEAAAAGAEGIGLFRTEHLFMRSDHLPDEEEQYEAYQAIADIMPDKPIFMRTMDAGGDNVIDFLNMEPERNPNLGHCAIRYCLDRPDMFKEQLRALLRASAAYHNIRIMLPVITCIEEVRQTRALLTECMAELDAKNIPYDPDIPLGAVIETPAAAVIADILAAECDCLSIGTNDLTQYTMAADRGNPAVANLYTHFQPAVLRLIRTAIQSGHEGGVPVAMCGAAAADPQLIPVLMSWGLDEFSVSIHAVSATRAAIAQWHKDEADQIAEKALELSCFTDIQAYLDEVTQRP